MKRSAHIAGTHAGWAGFAAVCVFALLLRVPIAAIPLERDEGEYAYIAQQWLQGGLPYRDSFDQKPPGVHIMYVLIESLGGTTAAAIHWATQVYTLGTLAVLFILGRHLSSPVVGLAAAAFAAFMTTDPSVLGNAANTEIFMLLPLTGAMLAACYAIERASLGWAFATGACAAVAVLFKQVALSNLVFDLLLVTWLSRRRAASAMLLLMGAVCAFLPLCAYFAIHGAWNDFLDATVGHNLRYAARQPLALYPRAFWMYFKPCLRAFWPVLLLATIPVVRLHSSLFRRGLSMSAGGPSIRPLKRWGLLGTNGEKLGKSDPEPFALSSRLPLAAYRRAPQQADRQSPRREGGQGIRLQDGCGVKSGPTALVLAWLVASFLGTASGGFFRPHYFMQSLPAVAVLAGIAVGSLQLRRFGGALRLAIRVACAAIPIAIGMRAYGWYYLPGNADVKARRIYGTNTVVEAPAVGRFIAAHSNVHDTVFIFGSEPQILYYAARRSASRYIFAYPLTNAFPDVRERQQSVLRELAHHQPRFIVTASEPDSFLTDPAAPAELTDGLVSLVKQSYALAAVTPMIQDGAAVLLTGERASALWRSDPLSCCSLVVWERRAEIRSSKSEARNKSEDRNPE